MCREIMALHLKKEDYVKQEQIVLFASTLNPQKERMGGSVKQW